jgi:hypothetical protein
VPTGPGAAGSVKTIAVSPDGKWVAVAGRAPMRGETGGADVPGVAEDFRRLLPTMLRDVGGVYLFDPVKPDGGKVLRGQRGAVEAVAFANPAPTGGAVLVTAGVEWDATGKLFGTVRVFDVTTGREIASRSDFPSRRSASASRRSPPARGRTGFVCW